MNLERIQTHLFKIAEAIEPVNNARLAAALVHKNRIIAYGFNKKVSHPFQVKFASHPDKIYLHAEISCIKNALRHVDVDFLKRCTMYVLRIKKSGKYFVHGLAKPCKGCQLALDTFGISKIIYTED